MLDHGPHIQDIATGEVVAIVGLTYADYSAEDLQSGQVDLLPEEDMLRKTNPQFLLPRPLGKNGRGRIVEMRTLWIKKSQRSILRLEHLESMVGLAHEALTGFDELKEQNVIHTYGTGEGVELYRSYGFFPLEPSPADPLKPARTFPYLSSDWAPIVTSLFGFEQAVVDMSIARVRDDRVRGGRHILIRSNEFPFQIALPNGFVVPMEVAAEGQGATSVEIDYATGFAELSVDRTSEISPGVFALRHVGLRMKGGEWVFVGQVARDCVIRGIRVRAGEGFAFDEESGVGRAIHLNIVGPRVPWRADAELARVQKGALGLTPSEARIGGLLVPQGSFLSFGLSWTGEVTQVRLGREALVSGVRAMEGSLVGLRNQNSYVVGALAEATRFRGYPTQKDELILPKGAYAEFEVDVKSKIPRLNAFYCGNRCGELNPRLTARGFFRRARSEDSSWYLQSANPGTRVGHVYRRDTDGVLRLPVRLTWD